LVKLQQTWPRGQLIGSLISDVAEARESIEYLLRHEMIELRCIEPGDFSASPAPLNKLELSLRNVSTSPWHVTSDPVV